MYKQPQIRPIQRGSKPYPLQTPCWANIFPIASHKYLQGIFCFIEGLPPSNSWMLIPINKTALILPQSKVLFIGTSRFITASINVFEDDVKNRKATSKSSSRTYWLKCVLHICPASALKMKQPQGVSFFCFLQANANQSTETTWKLPRAQENGAIYT